MSEDTNSGIMTRAEAIDVARAAARAKPQSYYAEPFEPHEWVVDAILAASRTQAEEIDRLRVNRDNSCTCPHGDASEPTRMHDSTCPIRVNKVKRIAPEVALARLAAALDSGDEADGLRAQLIETQARYDRLVSKANQLVRYWSAKGAHQELIDALDALGLLDDDL